MDPQYRADVIERSHLGIEASQSGRTRRASVLLAVLAAALGLVGCDNTPEDQNGLPDSGTDAGVDAGVDGGMELHASTPTIVRFEVKQVCIPGNQPADGI